MQARQVRSTPWTNSISPIVRYELREGDSRVLGEAESHAEGRRMLQAFVMTSPGREDDVWLVSVGADGSDVLREDVFDIEVDAIY